MKARGMTLIDVLIGTALVVIIFTGLFEALRVSVQLSSYIRIEAGAEAVGNNEMEYIRSLPYDSVGTVGGIPNGAIPQNSTVAQGGATYTVNTFVDYYDDPADGLGAADSNGITADYKQIKITVSYTVGTQSKQFVLTSTYSPPGLETTAGGGTLQILAVNAQGAPVVGATVQIINSAINPAVNLTDYTNVSGMLSLPGALPSTQYQVTVTKAGYSTALTYARDAINQNPTPGYLTVVVGQTTTSTFAIDQLASLTINTYSPAYTGTTSDTFIDASHLASQNQIATGANGLTLSGGPANYLSVGSAISTTTSPNYLASWGALNATISTPSNTTASVQVLNGANSLPIPDSVLPGNSTGFTTFPIDLSGVSTTTYPSLALAANLTSTSMTVTPAITVWSISAQVGPIPFGNVAYTLNGAKTIGSTGGGAPIYKTTVSDTTSSTGTSAQYLEWDSYGLTIPNYNIKDACGVPPYALAPGLSYTESVIVVPQSANEALISVTDPGGAPLPGASVTLSRGGYTSTVQTSDCGNAYFGNISSATDYSVAITKTGYTPVTNTGVTIAGQTLYGISF
jgi:hypothetical protein